MEKKILSYLMDACHYDPIEGKFFWKKRGFRRTIAEECGSTHGSGYRTMRIFNKQYQVHRLVWLIENGVFPKNEIDHINGVRSDNRIKNLRDILSRDNNLNTEHHRSGRLPGCHFCAYTEKWRAQIKLNGKRIHLGRYSSEKEASRAYQSARMEMGI